MSTQTMTEKQKAGKILEAIEGHKIVVAINRFGLIGLSCNTHSKKSMQSPEECGMAIAFAMTALESVIIDKEKEFREAAKEMLS